MNTIKSVMIRVNKTTHTKLKKLKKQKTETFNTVIEHLIQGVANK